jgi:hypothetical protein
MTLQTFDFFLSYGISDARNSCSNSINCRQQRVTFFQDLDNWLGSESEMRSEWKLQNRRGMIDTTNYRAGNRDVRSKLS